MALPEPKPGLVIRYAYLWGHEAGRGREEAAKDRPCAVVLTSQREGKVVRVWVVPITHTAPKDTAAIEVPAATKLRLGLDHEPSWIVTNELNSFEWPGPDLRQVDPRKPAGERFSYGFLPGSLVRSVIDSVLDQRQQGRSRIVARDERQAPQRPEKIEERSQTRKTRDE